MSDRIHLDTRAGYDRWSEVYDDEVNPLVQLEEPVVRGWLGDVAGLQLADVGCGTGRHARWMAESGASVDAFECSTGMMAKARAKLTGSGVRLHEHALPDPIPAPDDTYDITLLALVGDHLEDLEAAFSELRRVTRPGGQVVFTVLHPAMNLLGLTARFADPETGQEVRVAAYEHTYADYVMATLRSGLTIEELVERKADQALIDQAPRAEKYLGWPMLLAMRMKKLQDGEPTTEPRP